MSHPGNRRYFKEKFTFGTLFDKHQSTTIAWTEEYKKTERQDEDILEEERNHQLNKFNCAPHMGSITMQNNYYHHYKIFLRSRTLDT